jgi:transposase InsO family protein
LVDLRTRVVESVRRGIFEHVECFYKPERRYSSLGQMSPVEYEEARTKGAAVA